jgi:hypothetical protein
MNISLETKGKIVKSIVLCLGIVLVFLLAFFIIKIYTTDYTVTFMNEDNTVIETRKVRTGNSVIEPAEPRREGYKFLGWYFDNAKYDFSKKIKRDTIIYAKWEIDSDYVFSYVVSFDSNGGSAVDYQTIESGKTATVPQTPTKNGHVFMGWKLDGIDYDFNTPVIKDIKLVASWEVALTDDQTYLSVAREEVKDFAVVKANQTLKSTAVSGKCQITWTDADFNTVTRDTTDKNVTIVANIKCGSANAKKSVNVTIPASTYKYTMEKQGTTNYKFIAYDNDKILNNYNLYTSNQTSIVQKWQIHKDGDYLLVSKSKYVKNGTYYIAYEDDLNTKYAITIK